MSIGIGLPSFIRGMANTVKAKIAHFGRDNMRPGDIYVTNDAYTTGSHLYHMTFTLPIFHDGVLVGFSCCMAHWIDIGGTLGGMTTDIYSEGLQVPILKYQDQGKVNQDLVDIIRLNVRIPNRAMGDLRAQVTAVKTGERRFLQLIERYGRDEVLGAIAAIMDQAEAAARARTRTIPDGTYEASSFMDDDGVDVGKRVPIKVRVEVAGDEMTIDLTNIARQVRGFYNSGPSTAFGCAQMAYKCVTSPTDYPINDGAFRSLKVISPQGTVISAIRPAPMRLWMTYPMTVVDTVFKALAPAIPDRVIAGHHADLLTSPFHGINPRTSEILHRQLGSARRRLGRQARRGRRVRHRVHERRRHPQLADRAGRGEISGAGRALSPRPGLRRRRPPPRRPRHRPRGARALAHDGEHPGRPRPLQAVGPRGRPRRRRQRGRDPPRRQMERRFSQRQGAGGAARRRRRLSHALGRRGRVRRSVRAAGGGGR